MENDDIRKTSDTPSPAPVPGEPPSEPAAESAPAAGDAPAAAAAPSAAEGAEELRDLWLRAEADLQNYRRRAQREIEESRRVAEEAVMLEIIAAIDDLDRALAAVPPEGGDAAWAAGVRLVAQRLREFLARQGVSEVDPVGEPFDPTLHEALLELPAPGGTAPGTVLQVALRGYRRGARALRAARVVVARAAGG